MLKAENQVIGILDFAAGDAVKAAAFQLKSQTSRQ